MSDENKCRESGGAFIVSYAINEDEVETENLTHKESIGDEIEERGDDEFSYVIDFDESVEHAFVSTMSVDGLHYTHQKLTLQTVRQLADMFTRTVQRIRERQMAAVKETAELKAKQPTLPMEEKQ